ncbi:hypothetical protein LBMAG51_12440 [Phycisphaerae bacterium]|nr:hypothetical protein LBMAG51_12440 [Phycisphaerae bacterium]
MDCASARLSFIPGNGRVKARMTKIATEPPSIATDSNALITRVLFDMCGTIMASPELYSKLDQQTLTAFAGAYTIEISFGVRLPFR